MILKIPHELEKQIEDTGADVIVPMPQRFFRSWMMRGSPVLKTAHAISESLQIPILECLESVALGTRRQAELKSRDRIQNRIEFQVIDEKVKGKSVLLVDDFITTGHTVRRAAAELRRNGVRSVHIFSLGIRPLRSEERSDLVQSA